MAQTFIGSDQNPSTTALEMDLEAQIRSQLQRQRDFFATGQTQELEFRLTHLRTLKQQLIAYQEQILEAVHVDLHKPPVEAYAVEVGAVKEINFALKHLKSWMRPRGAAISLEMFPGRARVYPEPLGVALIIGPWNYPLQLMISPLVGAIAAGNCAILKPSELAPATSQVVANLIRDSFDPAYITVIEGGVEVSQALLEQKFDHIFFTGGTAIGRIVMQAAAKHLTPVTLELGGKSPCIVDTDVDLEVTARRIAWGKFINAGQTCIAPDYLLVDQRVKPVLLEKISSTITEFFGTDPQQSPDYGRIISDRHFQRLKALIPNENLVTGGQMDEGDRYIAPTVVDQVSPDDALMQDEIFGPILPVLTYEKVEEAIAFINDRPKPLALYLFSRNSQLQKQVLRQTSSGNACINDTIMQVGVSDMPFGGVGDSGIGSYHGKAGFDTFSHYKSVLFKPFWLDLPVRYAPYAGKLDLIKRVIQ
jgi:acyl-CoA reductase-like NAD-dependent aldehyde dehydrogenase